jgi:hypothetical protein
MASIFTGVEYDIFNSYRNIESFTIVGLGSFSLLKGESQPQYSVNLHFFCLTRIAKYILSALAELINLT